GIGIVADAVRPVTAETGLSGIRGTREGHELLNALAMGWCLHWFERRDSWPRDRNPWKNFRVLTQSQKNNVRKGFAITAHEPMC
ncbi:MAG: hypothetical protein R6U00_12275, partial [Prochlorococcaceae cyanobacterium]